MKWGWGRVGAGQCQLCPASGQKHCALHEAQFATASVRLLPLLHRQGYSWAEDKEHCEEYGRMLNADPSKVGWQGCALVLWEIASRVAGGSA